MSKFQKFLKGAWLFSFLTEILIVLYLVYCFFNGASFFFTSYDGLDAVFVGVIGLAVYWVFWVPVILFQIAIGIVMHIKPEYKEINSKRYFKNIKFYIPLIVILGVLLVLGFISRLDYYKNTHRVFSSTGEMSSAMNGAFCTNVYGENIKKDDYVEVLSYTDICNFALRNNAIDMWGDLGLNKPDDESEKYVLIVSHRINGLMRNIRCMKSERSGDEPLELHLEYVLDESVNDESVTLIYFKLPDNVKLNSNNEIKCIWHIK